MKSCCILSEVLDMLHVFFNTHGYMCIYIYIHALAPVVIQNSDPILHGSIRSCWIYIPLGISCNVPLGSAWRAMIHEWMSLSLKEVGNNDVDGRVSTLEIYFVSFDNFVFLQNGGVREIPVGPIWGKDALNVSPRLNLHSQECSLNGDCGVLVQRSTKKSCRMGAGSRFWSFFLGGWLRSKLGH